MNKNEKLFYIQKKNISHIAYMCKEILNNNKFLNEKISLFTKTISENKKLLEKYLKLLSLPKNNLIKIIKSDFKLKNQEIHNNILSLIKYNYNLKLKYLNLNDIIQEKNEMKQEYEDLLEKHFLIKNANDRKDNYIIKFYFDLKFLIDYPLFIEKKREFYLKESEILDEEFHYILMYYQNKLIKKSKKFNKLQNKINSLQNTVNNLNIEKKNINLITINTEENFNTTENIVNTTINNNLSTINNNLSTINNNIIDNNIDNNIEEHIDDFSDNLCNEELNNELNEIYFEDNIITYNYLKNKINIPKIDLKQIEFNKKKYMEEIMLSRELNSNEDNQILKSKIKEKKNKIKKYKIKIKIKIEKLRKYEEKIKEMKNYLIQNEKNYLKEIIIKKKSGFYSERFKLNPIIEQ
jgi:hypothetical protein